MVMVQNWQMFFLTNLLYKQQMVKIKKSLKWYGKRI